MRPSNLDSSPWCNARWFLIAPHPDDETLGAGALVHHACSQDNLAGIAFLTDGSGSHPHGTLGLKSTRKREARKALGLLSAKLCPIDWLGWQDGNPFENGSAAFDRAARRLAATIRDRRIDALAVSDPGDGHCDHIAAFDLACEARKRSHRRLQIFTYSVWNKPCCMGARFRTPPMPIGLRRQALRAHRSQLSPTMGRGFRLPSHMSRMQATDTLVAMDWPR